MEGTIGFLINCGGREIELVEMGYRDQTQKGSTGHDIHGVRLFRWIAIQLGGIRPSSTLLGRWINVKGDAKVDWKIIKGLEFGPTKRGRRRKGKVEFVEKLDA